MKKFLLSVAAAVASVSCFAHEGHGHSDGYSIKHYFVEPDHLFFTLISVVAVVILASYFVKIPAKK